MLGSIVDGEERNALMKLVINGEFNTWKFKKYFTIQLKLHDEVGVKKQS